jgi:hypothetical protein
MKQTRNRRNNRLRRVLRLLDLEHARAAVLNSLSSTESQRGYRHAIDVSWTGTVQSHGWRSIALWCFGIAVTWNPGDWPPRPSTFGWVPFGGWPMRPQIAGCSVPIWLRGFGG